MVLALGGDRYAALAMLGGFVGEVEVGPMGVRHLSYLAPSGSPYDNNDDEQIVSEEKFQDTIIGKLAF